VTESDFLAAVDKTARLLSRAFSFGCYDPVDIRQEVGVYAVELMKKGKYDHSRPLDAYILSHCRRRLINLRRDKLTRADPCPRCHAGDPCGPDGTVCEVYARWAARNRAKAALARPVDLGEVPPDRVPRTGESDVEARAEANELERVIDDHLPVELRADYLKLRAGQALPKVRRERVQEVVLDALEAAGLGLEDYGL
jgi:hypothetical protein